MPIFCLGSDKICTCVNYFDSGKSRLENRRQRCTYVALIMVKYVYLCVYGEIERNGKI